MTEKINIWVDPLCPYAWMTAQWMIEVEKVRDIAAQFNIMSLTVLNEDRTDLSEDYAERMRRGMGPVRVAMAVEQAHGKDGLRAIYLELAKRRHNEGREFSDELFREALEAAGFDPSLASAADEDTFDEAIRASHHEGMDPVGSDVGTPVIHFPNGRGDTTAFFGPVISPAPTGEEAGRLMDGLTIVAGTDGLYELKRSRDRKPEFLPMP
ncbi:MAG TPA: disulfide bond formation protein DsbA [Thermomicrobiales bacterium]|nr:disulfide bond formation protein DsbA [Thermomicrobiales bacterium]